MTSFYLDPAATEAYAGHVAAHADAVLDAIPPAPPSCCDGELDQALAAVYQLASAQLRTAGAALAGQARAARSAVRLYQLSEHRLRGMLERMA